MGIIRFNIVAPGWPSRPCQSPDFVGVSPTNTAFITCVLVPQVTTAGPLWGHCLLGVASNSTLYALRRWSAFMTALDLFNFAPAAGSWLLRGRAETWSCCNPGVRSSPSVALRGSKLVTANVLLYLIWARPVGGQILTLYKPVAPAVAVATVTPLRLSSMGSSPFTPSVVRWTSWALKSL